MEMIWKYLNALYNFPAAEAAMAQNEGGMDGQDPAGRMLDPREFDLPVMHMVP